MDGDTSTSPCQECGGEGTDTAETAHLKRHLSERDAHIIALEARLVSCSARTVHLEEQSDTWREKYERLYESHKRVQKLNQVLEDKLLQLVDRMKSEKAQLTKDIATLSVRLAHSKHSMQLLHKENERYKNDMNLAIQLLQCKPDNFVSHKLDNLPLDTQTRVSQFVMSKTKNNSPNLPTKNGNDHEPIDTSEYEFNVSASLMSKILEDSIQDTVTKHCDTCTCSNTQGNLFTYDERHYSVATQTMANGDMKNSLCLNCNGDVKSTHSNISNKSVSPRVHRILNHEERHSPKILPPTMPPVTLNPQLQMHPMPDTPQDKIVKENDILNDKIKSEDKLKLAASVQKEIVKKIGDDLSQMNNNFSMEPTLHHRLCDRTKTPLGSNVSDINILNDDTQKANEMEIKKEIVDERKNSLCSAGGGSRTSSVAKSTTSTHKSNTHVGPGPRFCSLRVQAGSKNILLDNAQPDVPPILYTRQTRCNDNILRDDDLLHDNEKKDDNANIEPGRVVESTLVDVHVDSTSKENVSDVTNVNPILMNVSASPLQPLRANTFTNATNSNRAVSVTKSVPLENNFDLIECLNDKPKMEIRRNGLSEKPPINSQDVKIFNFDLYEQNLLAGQYARPLRKIDMSQIAHIENTKISKDLPPFGMPDFDSTKLNTKPANINVYPNVTQTQIKVTDAKKAVVTEQSTSSLSSDDSAALLQKQQLIRVAEWVQQNLDQQNNFSLPSTDTNESYPPKVNRESKPKVDIVHKMPHPVTKYSNYDEACKVENACVTSVANSNIQILSNTIVKETVFPVECDAAPRTTDEVSKQTRDNRARLERKVSAEELARMEYNVKKFLLSGSQWATPAPVPGRSRRTSSKTETDL